MTGIEKIKERILSDARGEIARIEQEAKVCSGEIAASGETAAKEEYWKLFKKGTDDAEIRSERLASVAQLEAKKQVLTVKQELIAAAFEYAVQTMLNMPEEKNIDFLASLAVRASRTGKEEVIFPADTREKIGEKVVMKANSMLTTSGKRAELRLSEDTRGIRGGLILRDGSIEMNCSIDALVDNVRNSITGDVASILFK
jgi:V/A-type H+-transporting ATPase subunit E